MSISYLPAGSPVAGNREAQAGTSTRHRSRRVDAVCWAILAALVAVVLFGRLDHAMVPHDDGTIGQAAQRVLKGELPHHDFDDVYTGLLSVMNAAAFRLFGVNILAVRIVLVAGTLIAMVAVYGLCRRVLPAWAALLAATAALLSSVPNYFCPLPTWYNLFFTLFALMALLQYHDTQQLRWVAIAGALVGTSFLFKLVGLYFVAAAAMYVLFALQQRAAARPLPAGTSRSYWSCATIGGLWSYILMIVGLVAARPRVPELAVFVGPSLVIVAFLSWNEWRLRYCQAKERFLRLLGVGAIFFVGTFAVVGLYLLPYVAVGDVASWFNGVFINPMRRLDHGALGRVLPGGSFVLGVLLLFAVAGLLVAARHFKRSAPWIWTAIALVSIGLCAACKYPVVYRAVWSAARLTPLAAATVVVVWLAIRLRRSSKAHGARPSLDLRHAEETLLVVAAAGVFSLVQFPLSHGIYFLYVAPLAVLGGVYTLTLVLPAAVHVPAGPARTSCRKSGKSAAARASARNTGRQAAPIAAVVFAAWIAVFSLVWLLPGAPVTFGLFYYPAHWTARIPSARFPIRCDRVTAKKYEELIKQVKRHSRQGSAILAMPDAPEVYFLTGRQNPTRTFFDAFDVDYATPQRDQRLLDTIQRQQVDVVVLRRTGLYSRKGLSKALDQELRRRFPHEKPIFGSRRTGPDFIVRWRDPSPAPAAKPIAEVANR